MSETPDELSPDAPPPSPKEVKELVERVEAEFEPLRTFGVELRCSAIASAAANLLDGSTSLGKRARQSLPKSSGLSPEMIDWALDAALGALSNGELVDLVHCGAPRDANVRVATPRRCTLILAGNVFTACLPPIAYSLAMGVPVVCKASSRDDLFPRLFADALCAAEPAVGRALGVTSFPGGSAAHELILFEGCDLVIGYGSDATIRALRARVSATTRLIEHGHGVSVAYLGAQATSSWDQAMRVAARLALDTAAYDQRGCLSPHVVWLRDVGGEVGKLEFLELLHEALTRLDHELPRGPLPTEVAVAQMQWRAVAAVEGKLLEGKGHAVAASDSGHLVLGPGWRNLLILSCERPADVAADLVPFGMHLKQIGVACEQHELAELVEWLPPPLCPRLCPVGRMQTPPLDTYTEGVPPFDGFVRWVQVEH